jgi:hypothetical protein
VPTTVVLVMVGCGFGSSVKLTYRSVAIFDSE